MLGVLLGTMPATWAGGNYPFRVFTDMQPTHADVYAENQGHAPATIRVDLRAAAGVRLDRPWPVTDLVPPHATRKLASIHFETSETAPRWHLQADLTLGSTEARPVPFTYALPLAEGASFTVTRGLRPGQFRTVLGLMAPVGTPVVAAREGVVVELDLDHTEAENATGRFDRANSITVLHDDGTLADYLYLAPLSATVEVGQRVRAGQPLARTGQNALHFRVRQNTPTGVSPMAVAFCNGPDAAGPLELVHGSVGAVAAARGGRCGRQPVLPAESFARSAVLATLLALPLLVGGFAWLWRGTRRHLVPASGRRGSSGREAHRMAGALHEAARRPRKRRPAIAATGPALFATDDAFAQLKAACAGDVKMAFRLMGNEIRRAQPRVISGHEAIEAVLARCQPRRAPGGRA